jgi:hypothetical protein
MKKKVTRHLEMMERKFHLNQQKADKKKESKKQRAQ